MMTDKQRKNMVNLLEGHDIPLIEDEVYTDLYFTEKRPVPAQSCSTPMLQQWTLTNYLMSGEYDRHLQVLRKTLRYTCERMRALIAEHFPKEVCISQPQGGSVLWIRCRSHVDTSEFFAQAIAKGVSFAPGEIFSPTGKYKNFMRISYGVKWCDKIDKAAAELGKLVYDYPEKL